MRAVSITASRTLQKNVPKPRSAGFRNPVTRSVPELLIRKAADRKHAEMNRPPNAWAEKTVVPDEMRRELLIVVA